jgi:membrane fusion protein, multidrug efflux system
VTCLPRPALALDRAAAVVLAASVAVLGASCSRDEAPAGGKRSRLAQFPVEVTRVEARPHQVIVTAPGVVDAFEQVQITARVAGVVDRVTFVEGQDVKRGQILVEIDSRRYALAVSAARAALAKAEATEADNQASVVRRQNASKSSPGLIPGEELESYKTKLRTAAADVDSAREALKLARLNMEDSSVKAPLEGIVQTRSVVTGQYLQAGTAIATVLRRDPMLLRFHATTAEAPRLKVGMKAEFTLKESRRVYAATITLVAGAADSESRLVPITARVEAPDHRFWLRPGSFAQVQVKLAAERLFPLIPQTATRPSDRGFLAYVVEGDTAHERVLQLGLHTIDGWVEAREGLAVGELLVTRGLEALAEGTKVRVVDRAPTAATTAPSPSSDGAAKDRPGSRAKRP